MESSLARAWWLASAGLALGLVATVGFFFVWSTSVPGIPSASLGRTELAFDYFEQTLKMWNSQKTAETFAEDVIVRFYNQGTKEEKVFVGRSGAIDMLQYATGLGCAKLQDTIVVREVDEAAKMVYITWDYPKSISNFCGPSGEMYIFDDNYKISRLNTLVDWRIPRANATLVAFSHFEHTQEAWDLEATAQTFAEDAVTRFHNLGTGEEKIFNGRAGAKDLLTYAQELGCAKLRDTVTTREVDEDARMVYISWKYPKSEGVSNFCRPSAEVYSFDRNYQIFRLNTIVDWRAPLANATAKAFDHFERVFKTWDLDRTAQTFSHDAVVTFYNQATKELKNFQGRLGAKELLLYATELRCAKLRDTIRFRKVDETAKTVYIAWDYPAESNVSGHCGLSAEMYLFNEEYEIFRMNGLVDWQM
eukprot:CAMPEP_0179077452 /NCGR_PEP_ID=MMETSP0796-20121207/34621_1 /TAXON_ID=73915 /ORGANISM="Pyrodinium bahamense, Strain pbaha01" /LENGTH=418 /DNA_ID=CAMNT_0020774731 /DNA_START=240 /DNA_END=1496 /DNA_ORIENTATION=+